MKAQKRIQMMEQEGYKFLRYSSVWDVHHARIGKSKNSRVYKDARPFLEEGKEIVAVIGAKGRSQHSKTEVILFDATGVEQPILHFNIHEITGE